MVDFPWQSGGLSAPQSQGAGGNDIASLLKYLQEQQQQPQMSPAQAFTQGVPSAAYSFQGKNLAPQQQSTGEISNLANASYNQDNPLYQQIYGQEKGSAQQDLAASIAELQRQNRKSATMGRVPLFDNERGGEQQFRAITQGYQTAQDTARQRARTIIGAGQNAQSGALAAQNSLATQQLQNNAMKASGWKDIASILPFLGL